MSELLFTKNSSALLVPNVSKLGVILSQGAAGISDILYAGGGDKLDRAGRRPVVDENPSTLF